MADLAHVLRHLPRVTDVDLLLGDDPADDAAVYRIRDDLALVQTVDFFTPIVDDPYTYGQIAAANSLSDIYAVGGTPITALNVVGFPVKDLPLDTLTEILRGGSEKAAEAGVAIVGGHTVDDAEPKYGLSVTGTVDPTRIITPRGARPGDAIVLTKPIGTGTIATALRAGDVAKPELDQAILWMTTLNASAAAAMRQSGATAATDITGFGLLGHLSDLCRASGVAASISFARVPFLPFATGYVQRGYVPGGTYSNLEYLGDRVHIDPSLDEWASLLLADPQTSGGLLVTLPSGRIGDFISASTGTMIAAEIGQIEDGPRGHIRVDA